MASRVTNGSFSEKFKEEVLLGDRRELVDSKMPRPLSDEELQSLTPEALVQWYGNAVVAISEMVDSLDHEITAMGTSEIQDVTFAVRASVPGHPFWHEQTSSGRVW